MAFVRAEVQDEGGGRISEGVDFPSSMLPDVDDGRFRCLGFVDPYGNTVFNLLQIPIVLRDLEVLKGFLANPDQQELIQQLKVLCLMCQSEPHLYLKFIGD